MSIEPNWMTVLFAFSRSLPARMEQIRGELEALDDTDDLRELTLSARFQEVQRIHEQHLPVLAALRDWLDETLPEASDEAD
jgi:hypothetical protein